MRWAGGGAVAILMVFISKAGPQEIVPELR